MERQLLACSPKVLLPCCPRALQLPVLKDLQRVIDELAFGVASSLPSQAAAAPVSSLIVEQVGGEGRGVCMPCGNAYA